MARTYVLIPDAWHGGWAWRLVVAGLRAAGHEANALTLTGLGERRHISQAVDLDTHIEDVLSHIEMEDLSNVTLVGWSYGGAVATGVLARIPDKIGAMIYLDAFVPQDGQALVDYLPLPQRAAYDAFKDADRALPPLPIDRLGLTDPVQIDHVQRRLVPQPWRTFYQPVKALPQLPRIPIAYIGCTVNQSPIFASILAEMKDSPSIRTDTIDTGHSCMLTEPDETIRLLERYGG
ncbi:MAG TPA: alpha/beta hydrolase family protein [Dongiaceae bacterium]|nr:alpha/beta hydrolase family protein [Dongiaceae bacterium]